MCRFLLIAFTLCVCSCATIPPQAPQLSTELGMQIGKLEKSHLSLVDAYFDQKRERLDEFINDVWLPEFSREFFSDAQIAGAWEQIVASKDPNEKLEFLIRVGGDLQSVINEKRSELHAPLEELQRAIETSIREEYALAYSANNSLTSFLTTAAKIDENRSRYLKMLNISNEKITDAISKTDEALEKLLNRSEQVSEKVESMEKFELRLADYKGKIVDVIDKIRK